MGKNWLGFAKILGSFSMICAKIVVYPNEVLQLPIEILCSWADGLVAQ